jgi:rhamnogalacturonyl hydrolase YesR
MKEIYALIMVALSTPIMSQSISKQEVINNIKIVADNVIKNTTYLYYDQETGSLISDIQKYGYNESVVPQNGYNAWTYFTGVLQISLNELGKMTQEPKYKIFSSKNFEFFFKDYQYLKDYYVRLDQSRSRWKNPLSRVIDIIELDDCGVMGASLIELYRYDKKPVYEEFLRRAENHIMKKQMRLADGTFARENPEHGTVWGDDLYMSVPFLARMGELTGNKVYFEEAVKQVILFNQHLYNEKVGLFWHCYYDDLKINGGTYWGRCNGWIMMATADLLRFLPSDHPQRGIITSLLFRQILNIAQYQSQSGLWHQILNKEDSYLETSCSAMFAYSIALAVNQGWINQRYKIIALNAWDGIKAQITKEGAITNICVGTGISDGVKYYYDRPTPYNDIHGLGAVILAGVEVSKIVE